jgi:hypothetical protein
MRINFSFTSGATRSASPLIAHFRTYNPRYDTILWRSKSPQTSLIADGY